MRHVPTQCSDVAPSLRQHNQRLSPHVQDEIEYRQIGDELPVPLRITRMDIIVPDDLDAGGFELRLVEIVLRGIARDIPGRAEMMAKVDESLVAIAANVEFGCAVTRRRNSDLRGEPIDEREVEVDEAWPGPLNDVP